VAEVGSGGGSAPAGGDPGARRSADSLVGAVIGDKFRILGALARGGFGTVYRAEQLSLLRPVALKVLRSVDHAGHNLECAQRFLREAATAARLQHPNIVAVHDFGQDGGLLYLVMELLSGPTLADVLAAEGALPPERAVHIAEQICLALREAHDHAVVHRDIKPANVVLVDRDGDADTVKVLDFGLVAHLESQERLTQEGVALGTPHYMSPEHCGAHKADSRTDIYTLGVVMYRMLAGHPPFDGSDDEIIAGHLYRPAPRLAEQEAAARTPPRIERAVMRCLCKHPDDRFQSVNDLLAELRDEGDEAHPAEAPGQRPVEPVAKAPRRRWPLPLALLLLAVGVVGVVELLREPAEPPAAAASTLELAVRITSTPPGALVVVDGRELGETPLEETWRVPVSAAPRPYVVEVKLAGYRAERLRLWPVEGRLGAEVRLRR